MSGRSYHANANNPFGYVQNSNQNYIARQQNPEVNDLSDQFQQFNVQAPTFTPGQPYNVQAQPFYPQAHAQGVPNAYPSQLSSQSQTYYANTSSAMFQQNPNIVPHPQHNFSAQPFPQLQSEPNINVSTSDDQVLKPFLQTPVNITEPAASSKLPNGDDIPLVTKSAEEPVDSWETQADELKLASETNLSKDEKKEKWDAEDGDDDILAEMDDKSSNSEDSTKDSTPEPDADMSTDGKKSTASSSKKKSEVKDMISTAKEHVNVVFIGHVDAGKSTIAGQLLYLTGMVDKRTLEKYEREAREKNRESWYLSWALDTNQEEREKGKTVEVGRAYFETEKKHFTILDAPGHKSFVPNMISGASQADLAILVISARRGEFETGFDRGGQTREHAMLAKTLGVLHMIVLINKMDDPTVEWDHERYKECQSKLQPFLRKCGFKSSDVVFFPCSGLTGDFLMEPAPPNVCSWWKEQTLVEYLESMPALRAKELETLPARIPIVDRFRDMGTIVIGKVEAGLLTRGQVLTLMPNRVSVEIIQIWSDDSEVDQSLPGENVKIKLKGVDEEDVSPGFVLCDPSQLCRTGHIFDAQIVILEHNSIITAGYKCILHIHSCAEEVTIRTLICLVDRRTGEKHSKFPRFIKQDQAAIVRLVIDDGMICIETFKDFPQLGRLTLRDEGRTVAIGKVLKVVE